MAIAIANTSNAYKAKDRQQSRSIKPVLKLLVSILLILVFMLYIGPRLGQLPWFKPLADFIEERDINANMYFYTEVEEFSEANINMLNTMAYPPGSSR
jgi:hypothetical protein